MRVRNEPTECSFPFVVSPSNHGIPFVVSPQRPSIPFAVSVPLSIIPFVVRLSNHNGNRSVIIQKNKIEKHVASSKKSTTQPSNNKNNPCDF
jgi:hypothetical protein